jgi:hypothetical protein
MLIEQGTCIEWGCFGRINLMTPDLIELMAQAGCRAIFYGIDSGSQPILDRTLKKVRAGQILPVLKASAQHFDQIEASFIWGYPFESLDDFKRSLDLAGEASLLSPKVDVQMHMLSPLPLSPIFREYPHGLLEPEVEDRPWLLLPALLLDNRSIVLRELIRDAPDIYPGFFTFPTPAKRKKRELLRRSLRALDHTIGSTFFDPSVASLLKEDCEWREQQLLASQLHPADRVGVGLALGFFRRLRNRDEFASGRRPFEGTRGPGLIRERAEPMQSEL